MCPLRRPGGWKWSSESSSWSANEAPGHDEAEWLRLPARVVPALMAVGPVILVAAAYVTVVQPRVGESGRARAKARALQARLTELETAARGAPPGPVAAGSDGARREFERRTPAEDPSPVVLQALARLAAGAPDGAVREVSIESSRQRVAAAPDGTGARAREPRSPTRGSRCSARRLR